MINFINPLDLILVIILLIMGGLGFYAGFINELKKTISLLISALVAKVIVYDLSFLNNVFNHLLIYIVTILILIYFIRLILNILTTSLSIPHIDKEVNGFMGGIFGITKGIILISILLFVIELSPIQDTIKNRAFNKFDRVSTLFNICNSAKEFLLH